MRRLRRKLRASTYLAVVLAVLAVGCGSGEGDPEASGTNQEATETQDTTETGTPTAGETAGPGGDGEALEGQLNIVYGTADALPEWPTQLAWEILRERGLEVDVRFLTEPELGIQAVVQGDASHVMALGTPSLLVASEQAENLKGFFNHKWISWVVISRPEIETIEDISGHSFGIHSEVSFTKNAKDQIIEEYGLTDVSELVVPGADVRAQAIASGQLDVTIVDLADTIVLEDAGVEFNRLAELTEVFPGVMTSISGVDQNWVDENPDLAAAVTEALLEAYRWVNENPDEAVSRAQEHYADQEPETVEKIVRTYIDEGIWDPEGGIDAEAARNTLVVLGGDLEETDPEAVPVERFFNLELVEAAKSGE